MTSLRVMAARLWALCRRRQLEAELEDELRDHRERDADDRVRQGASRADAERAARHGLGNTLAIRERWRDAKGFTAVDEFVQDVRYSLRTLRRSPGFTGAAVLTLALGIGGTTAISSVVNAVLLRPLPYPDADRLVRISVSGRPGPGRYPGFNAQEYLDLRSEARTLSDVGLSARANLTLTTRETALRVNGLRVSPAILTMLGARPFLGRAFRPDEERAGRDAVVILGYETWVRAFADDTAVLERRVSLDGRQYSVVGVMPPDLRFPEREAQWQPDFWIPLVVATTGPGSSGRLRPMARLAPGASLEVAVVEITGLLVRWRAQPPVSSAAVAASPPPPSASSRVPPVAASAQTDDAPWFRVSLARLADELVAPVRPGLWTLAGAAFGAQSHRRLANRQLQRDQRTGLSSHDGRICIYLRIKSSVEFTGSS